MKQRCNTLLLAAIVLLPASCNKEQLPGTAPGPVSSNPPGNAKLISRIYIINVLPAGPDTVTEVTLHHDLSARLAYTVSRNRRNPAAAAPQYVSYYYNGADTLPTAIMHYDGAAITKTIFNNYVNGVLKSDSALSYNAAGALTLAQSTVFLTGTSLAKSRMLLYRISNGAPSAVFLRDSMTCRIRAKDNNNNLLNCTIARNDSPFPSFTNAMSEYANSFDAGINPMHYYFRHGNTAFDPVSPEYEEGVLKLLAATSQYPQNTYRRHDYTHLSHIVISGGYHYTYTSRSDSTGRITVIDKTFNYPAFSMVQTTRIAFVYQYP